MLMAFRGIEFGKFSGIFYLRFYEYSCAANPH